MNMAEAHPPKLRCLPVGEPSRTIYPNRLDNPDQIIKMPSNKTATFLNSRRAHILCTYYGFFARKIAPIVYFEVLKPVVPLNSTSTNPTFCIKLIISRTEIAPPIQFDHALADISSGGSSSFKTMSAI